MKWSRGRKPPAGFWGGGPVGDRGHEVPHKLKDCR